MVVNFNKTKEMIVTYHPFQLVKCVDTVELLGIKLDANFS